MRRCKVFSVELSSVPDVTCSNERRGPVGAVVLLHYGRSV